MKRTKLVYHLFFTHCRIGRMFNLRPSSPWFEPYCLFVCLLICLFVCVFHGSDIMTCTTSGLQILVTLCKDVRNGFSYIPLKIIEGPILSIVTLMHFVQNVFRKPILRSSLIFSNVFNALLPSETARRKR